jgi:hypothetical protein
MFNNDIESCGDYREPCNDCSDCEGLNLCRNHCGEHGFICPCDAAFAAVLRSREAAEKNSKKFPADR